MWCMAPWLYDKKWRWRLWDGRGRDVVHPGEVVICPVCGAQLTSRTRHHVASHYQPHVSSGKYWTVDFSGLAAGARAPSAGGGGAPSTGTGSPGAPPAAGVAKPK